MTNNQIAQLLSIALAIAGIIMYIRGNHISPIYAFQVATYQAFGISSSGFNPYEVMKWIGAVLTLLGGIMFIGYLSIEITDDN